MNKQRYWFLAYLAIVALIVVGSPRFSNWWAQAGYVPFPVPAWNASPFESDPAATDSVSEGDDHIRDLKKEIRNRAEVGHEWGSGFAGGASTDTGRHSMGSARIYVQSAEPGGAGTEEGPPQADTAASQSVDLGRIWKDSDIADGELRYTDTVGGDYVRPLVTVLEGDPDQGTANTIKITGPTTFCEGDFATECMDLHNHVGRHEDTDSLAAEDDYSPGIVKTFSPAPVISATIDQVNCTGAPCDADNLLDAGELATQATVTIDTTGRRGVSRVIFFGRAAYDIQNQPTAAYCFIADSGALDTPLPANNVSGNSVATQSCQACSITAVIPNVAAGGVQTFHLRLAEDRSANALAPASAANCAGGGVGATNEVPTTDLWYIDFGPTS